MAESTLFSGLRGSAGSQPGLLAGLLLLAMAGCGSPSQAPANSDIPDTFSMSTSRYVTGSTVARLEWNDPRAGFGSVAAMLAVDSGYVVADGRNQEIVFLDKALNPVKKIGRHGEGPGEFQFPSALTAGDDFVAVLDEGLARVYQLTADGDLLRSMQVTSDAEDLAVHSRLGVLTTGTAFPGYYLTMAHDEAPLAFGRIPDEFYPSELMASGYRARNLVAATADGMVHVLDGEHLAVVGFEEDGNRTDLVFLPHDIRAALLDRRAQRREAFGAASLGGADVTALIPLPDGRVFAVLAYEDTAGLVLDLAAREAIPIVMPPDERDWIWGSRIFDGESLVLSGEFGDISIVATRLVSQ